MRLNETEMVKLLPAWMQEDGSDKGLATGCDIISRDAYARLKLLSRWDKIDQLQRRRARRNGMGAEHPVV